MAILFTNNASATLASGIGTGNTTITLTTGKGAIYPSPTAPDYFMASLQEGSNIEIVKVTARTGDVFSVVRGQEGTTPQLFTSAATLELRLTAGALTGFPQSVAPFSATPQTNGASISGGTLTFGPASATVPGLVSTGTQTFAGSKTFNGSINSLSTITASSTVQGANVAVVGAGTESLSSAAGALFQADVSGNALVSQDGRHRRRLFWDRDAMEFGVKLDVPTDSTSLTNNTAACQAALDYLYAQAQLGNPGKIVWPNGGAIRINSTLVQRGNSAMSGANVGAIPQGPNFDGGAARFEWWGADNGTMWFCEGCNKGIMEDLAFYGNDKAGCCVEYSGSTFADRSIPAATSGYVTRRCRFVNLKPGVTGNACIKIGTDPTLTGGGTTQFSEAGWYQCDFTPESPGAAGFSYAALAADAIKFMCTGNTKNFTFDRIGCTVGNHFMNGFGSGYCLMKNFSVGDVKYGFTGGGTVRLEGGDFECGNVPDFKLITGGNFADRIAMTDTEVFVGVAPSGGHTILIDTGANLVFENNEFAICAAGDVTGTRIHFEIKSGGCISRNNLYLGFDDSPHAPLFDGGGNPMYPMALEFPRLTPSFLTNKGTYSSTGDRCSAGSGANERYMVDYTAGLEPERSLLKLQDLGSDFGRPAALHEGQSRTSVAMIKIDYNMVKSRIQSSLFSQGALIGPIGHVNIKRVWCEILTPFAGVAGVTCSIDNDQLGNANIMASCDPTQAANTLLGVDPNELGHLMRPGDPLYSPHGYYYLPNALSYNTTIRLSFTSPATNLSSLSAGQLLVFIEYSWFGHA